MATPLTDAINALTRYANETTGASDTNLSDAVGTLVSGYGQGGGSGHARVAYYGTFEATEVYYKTNKYTLQLEASNNCYIRVSPTMALSPDETYYLALYWGYDQYTLNGNKTSATSHKILRSNGTIGTDSTLCHYDTISGELSLGGSYGAFLPGNEYEIIQIIFE